MAKLPNGATWIQDNMPLGASKPLSDQEVVDITLYIDAQEREPNKGFKVEDNFKKLGKTNYLILFLIPVIHF